MRRGQSHRQSPDHFFGGPPESGSIDGGQADKVRVPFADIGLVKLPEGMSDGQAVLFCDALPTAYFALQSAGVDGADSLAVFGAGPVGLSVGLLARALGVKGLFFVDKVPARLDAARRLCDAAVVDFSREDPPARLKELTRGQGPAACIDAVGMEAEGSWLDRAELRLRLSQGSTQAIRWAADAVRKGGTVSVAGTYGKMVQPFPLGLFTQKNLKLVAGTCPHRAMVEPLLRLFSERKLDLAPLLTHRFPLTQATQAYHLFEEKADGALKVLFQFQA